MPDPDANAELLDDRTTPLTRAGTGAGPWTVRGVPVWLLILVSVLVALVVSVSRLGTPDPRLAAVPTAGLLATQPVPSPVLAETLQPTPTADTGPCGTGGIQFHTNAEPLPLLDLDRLRVPTGGLLALVAEENTTGGSLVLANARGDEGGTTVAAVIATFTGSDIQPGQAVTPIAWSKSGYALLVSAGHRGANVAEETCSDLHLLRYEDSRVIVSSLTHADGPGGRAEGAALSGDGERVGYIQGNDIRLLEVVGPRPSAAFNSCDHPRGPVRLSPNETRLLAICDRAFVVVDLDIAESGIFSAAPDTILLTAGWTGDADSIVSVAARTGAIQSSPLVIFDVDRIGRQAVRFETEVSSQWVVGTSTMSPDSRWALVQGDSTDATYAVDTTTAAVTKLPWFVLPVSFEPLTIAWLADGNSFLYTELETLYEVDLAAMTRTEVGAVPLPNFAWHESAR
ncbi:MAG TPA: hypothetical protein VEX41_09035 [Candidatus Eisenbacteria bacterium]|nr:hypothetical protein [Candidatus Eisenbacteria bacterium]